MMRRNGNLLPRLTGFAKSARAGLLVVGLLLAAGCARQGYPPGGPKDVQPPAALGARPANESRGFNEKEFFIQFDEYVVLKNATENVLVSPPMKEKPEYISKGKGVLVRIKDTLQPNTTYLFQFKDAIADFTEGNLLPSFEYVFSTGDAMDTMALAGMVLDGRNGKPWKETVTVVAYKEGAGAQGAGSDTMACSQQPDYVTRCDKAGHFAFHYIPAGRYRLVAMADKNSNLRVDMADAAAWDTMAVASHAASDSSQQRLLLISQPDNAPQRITKSEFVDRGCVQIVTSRPMIKPVVEGDKGLLLLNPTADTLTLWCERNDCDSLRLVVSDESGLKGDTLRLRYMAKPSGKRTRAGEKPKKPSVVTPLCDGNKAYYDDLRVAFSSYVDTALLQATAEIMNLADSSVGHCRLVPVAERLGMQARLDTVLVSGKQYRVRIAAGAFRDFYGNASDSLQFTLTPKDYGTLSLSIDNRTGQPLVLEVLDKNDTVLQKQSLTASGVVQFRHLPTGNYRLRAVVDADGNGRWTPGDYRRQRQPEQWYMFEKTLNLREKWEMEEKWTVGGVKMEVMTEKKSERSGKIAPVMPQGGIRPSNLKK